MVIEIQGLKLPELLEKLINDRIWAANFYEGIEMPTDLLEAVGITEKRIVFPVSLEEFLKESKLTWHANMDAEELASYTETHAYVSSKLSGRAITDSTKLDIDKAILIAYADNDDVVFLDYRLDPDKPQVVVLNWVKRTWHSIGDFETFVKKIGFVD